MAYLLKGSALDAHSLVLTNPMMEDMMQSLIIYKTHRIQLQINSDIAIVIAVLSWYCSPFKKSALPAQNVELRMQCA